MDVVNYALSKKIKKYVDDINSSNQVQSDWNQNDSTAADYVKGRTHYEESTYVDYVLNMNIHEIVGLSMPEVGETMTVKINGVESAETVKETESSIMGFSYKYIGNIDVDSLLNVGTGWCIANVSDKTIGLANQDTTITIEVVVIHKINDNFINFDGVVRTFDYYFRVETLYKSLYKDNGDECLLYTCNSFILPETGYRYGLYLLGFMDHVGFSKIDSIGSNACFIIGVIINITTGSIRIQASILGTNTNEMEKLAASYGYTHNTNPNA